MITSLIIVDPQNDFCEGGSLAVPQSLEIFTPINIIRTRPEIKHVFITLDWHPPNHVSFAEQHQMAPFTNLTLPNGSHQQLWPTHCIMNGFGSGIHSLLTVKDSDIFIQKGYLTDVESYSGFGTPAHPTSLLAQLQQRNVSKVIVTGLAFDYCVGQTALDAAAANFQTYVIKECTRAISAEGQQKMEMALNQVGVKFGSFYDLNIW